MTSQFDQVIPRTGTHSAKWDMMEPLYGVSPDDGISMWVADMDFRPPACVQDAVDRMAAHGIYGYFGGDSEYRAAIQWWMKTRHGWDIETDWISTTHGLVNAVGLCVDTFTKPGDGVVLMTPVYHAFARVIAAADRTVVECELAQDNGRYVLDIDAWDAQMTGSETMLILCSPHNPGGRVWSKDELQAVADFAKRHDLILVSDEIHHDLVLPGQGTHTMMAKVDPDLSTRLVTLTASTKTFNIAGCHTGNVIIADADLRAAFQKKLMAIGIGPNSFGMHMATAAYSPEGAAWVDELITYLDGNRQILADAFADIPGAKMMDMQSTYLAWVDFSGTGMTQDEIVERVQSGAKIAANLGPSFGKGGENWMRFNFATPRSLVEQAATRLKAAFADLQ